MKKVFVFILVLIIGTWLLLPPSTNAHILDNNGKWLKVDDQAVACGGSGDQCYWSRPPR